MYFSQTLEFIHRTHFVRAPICGTLIRRAVLVDFLLTERIYHHAIALLADLIALPLLERHKLDAASTNAASKRGSGTPPHSALENPPHKTHQFQSSGNKKSFGFLHTTPHNCSGRESKTFHRFFMTEAGGIYHFTSPEYCHRLYACRRPQYLRARWHCSAVPRAASSTADWVRRIRPIMNHFQSFCEIILCRKKKSFELSIYDRYIYF